MSGDNRESDGRWDLSRRSFMRTTGVAAGAGAFLASGATAGSTDDAVGLEFANPRVRRAAHAWQRGFRGRSDRTLAITDTGSDSRHPDVGPWNGVTATTEGDELELYQIHPEKEPRTTDIGSRSETGVATSAGDSYTIEPPAGTGRIGVRLEYDVGAAIVESELYEETGDDEEDVEVLAVRNPGHEVLFDFADDGATYRLEVFASDAPSTYEVTVNYYEYEGSEPRKVPVENPFAGVGDTPQLVGWHNDHTRYGDFRAPRDENSHGTHVSSIMTGSGRAAAIDQDRSTVDEGERVLPPGETLTYEVDAGAGTGVFGSAYGNGIEIVIYGPDGEQLRRSRGAFGTSEESFVNNTAETPTVHGQGEATYIVEVRPTEGVPHPARVERVAAGAFLGHDETGAEATGEDRSLHAGIAPGYSLLTLTSLSDPTIDLGKHADDFAETFNLRAVNMSWGYIGGLPFGTVAGAGGFGIVEALGELAEAGVVPVAAAGNDGSPATGNAPPAVADEAVSVVATGPLDGIASYSSGGLGGVDDETGEPYGKPEVTAIGGVIPDLDQAAIPGDYREDSPYTDDEAFGEAREFSGKGGTSMASPSACGAVGLVAQAMEEAAPGPIELPAPADAGLADALRVKQTLLATASTTAFNAAPYHRGKAPVYSHGERDPYEGYGRVNVGAAVDAVSRDLTEADTGAEVVGLDVPDDEQAVAGYVEGPGSYDVSVSFTGYDGSDADRAGGPPHVDLFVYDAVNPEGIDEDAASTGEPNVVTSDQGVGGEASVSFDADENGVYFVVVELVNVPGAVNGADIQAELDLAVDGSGSAAAEAADDGHGSGDRRADEGARSDEGDAETESDEGGDVVGVDLSTDL